MIPGLTHYWKHRWKDEPVGCTQLSALSLSLAEHLVNAGREGLMVNYGAGNRWGRGNVPRKVVQSFQLAEISVAQGGINMYSTEHTSHISSEFSAKEPNNELTLFKKKYNLVCFCPWIFIIDSSKEFEVFAFFCNFVRLHKNSHIRGGGGRRLIFHRQSRLKWQKNL